MQALEGEKTEKLSRLCEIADTAFCWLSSHIGIIGNEEADKAAREILPLKVLSYDFKPLIKNFIQNVWQQSWSIPASHNKLSIFNQVLVYGFRDCG